MHRQWPMPEETLVMNKTYRLVTPTLLLKFRSDLSLGMRASASNHGAFILSSSFSITCGLITDTLFSHLLAISSDAWYCSFCFNSSGERLSFDKQPRAVAHSALERWYNFKNFKASMNQIHQTKKALHRGPSQAWHGLLHTLDRGWWPIWSVTQRLSPDLESLDLPALHHPLRSDSYNKINDDGCTAMTRLTLEG